RPDDEADEEVDRGPEPAADDVAEHEPPACVARDRYDDADEDERDDRQPLDRDDLERRQLRRGRRPRGRFDGGGHPADSTAPTGVRAAKSSAICSKVTQRAPSWPLMYSINRSSISSTCGRPLTSGWIVSGNTAYSPSR